MSTTEKSELIEKLEKQVRRFLAGGILFNEKVAAEVGLNATDLQCLNLLELQGSATPGDLARGSALTTGGVTVALDRLEKAGYVKRLPNPEDRRSTIIKPAAARLRQLGRIYKSKTELLTKAAAEYDESELKVILTFFEKINTGAAASSVTRK